MTATQMEKELIRQFGPLGGTKSATEKFLQIGCGTLPPELEHTIVPGKAWPRYCPRAVAEWLCKGRVPGYYARMPGGGPGREVQR
jgi:hypothetical protein